MKKRIIIILSLALVLMLTSVALADSNLPFTTGGTAGT